MVPLQPKSTFTVNPPSESNYRFLWQSFISIVDYHCKCVCADSDLFLSLSAQRKTLAEVIGLSEREQCCHVCPVRREIDHLLLVVFRDRSLIVERSCVFTRTVIPYSTFCAFLSTGSVALLMFGVFPLCGVTINQMIYNLTLAGL